MHAAGRRTRRMRYLVHLVAKRDDWFTPSRAGPIHILFASANEFVYWWRIIIIRCRCPMARRSFWMAARPCVHVTSCISFRRFRSVWILNVKVLIWARLRVRLWSGKHLLLAAMTPRHAWAERPPSDSRCEANRVYLALVLIRLL